MELSGKVWQASKIMLKSENMDQRIQLCVWKKWRPPQSMLELDLQEGEAEGLVPRGVCMYTVPQLGLCFGALKRSNSTKSTISR